MTHEADIAGFVSYVKNDGCANRVLIIEPTCSHQEVILSLIYFFNRLGFGVDVLLTVEQIESRKIAPVFTNSQADVRFFYSSTASNFKYLALLISKSKYQFIYFNTIFEPYVDQQRKNLCQLISKSGIKCFGTIHNLDNYLHTKHLFPEISKENIFALGKSVADNLNVAHIDTSFFMDGISDSFNLEDSLNFICIGEVSPRRRDYNKLIDVCIAIKDKDMRRKIKVYVACQSSQLEYYHTFRENIIRYDLDEMITVLENLSFPDLFSLAGKMHFQLFLLNKNSSQNRDYLAGKITGGLNISLGFGLIPVVEEDFADAWEISDFSVKYVGTDGLIHAIEKIADAPTEFSRLKATLLAENSKRLEQSIAVLKSRL